MIVPVSFDISLTSSKDLGGNGGTRAEQGHEGSDVWRALAAEMDLARSNKGVNDVSKIWGFSRPSTRRETWPE